MRIFYRASVLVSLLCLASALPASSRQTAVPPPSRAHVTDLAELLSPTERAALNEKLRAYEDTTSTQIVVVTMPRLENISAAEMATRIGHEWGVGQRGQDNGLVILVDRDNRDVFIATGYGLEGAIPDAIAGRVVRNILVPAFRQGRYYAGLDRAVDALIDAARGEFRAAERRPTRDRPTNTATMFVILIILFFFLNSMRGGGKHMGGRRYHRRVGIPPVIIFGPGMAGGRRGGGFGGGGFGGGGFGGFSGGGGGFGGGGAGGSW